MYFNMVSKLSAISRKSLRHLACVWKRTGTKQSASPQAWRARRMSQNRQCCSWRYQSVLKKKGLHETRRNCPRSGQRTERRWQKLFRSNRNRSSKLIMVPRKSQAVPRTRSREQVRVADVLHTTTKDEQGVVIEIRKQIRQGEAPTLPHRHSPQASFGRRSGFR